MAYSLRNNANRTLYHDAVLRINHEDADGNLQGLNPAGEETAEFHAESSNNEASVEATPPSNSTRGQGRGRGRSRGRVRGGGRGGGRGRGRGRGGKAGDTEEHEDDVSLFAGL